MTAPKRDSRSHSHEVAVGAPPDVVWRAITQAEQLVKWFPFTARSTPGRGGAIELEWGAPFRGLCRIETWEPPRHLRMTWLEAPPGAAGSAGVAGAKPTFVDWHLEAKGGGTVVRLVHSGFGGDASFDDEFDGTRRGWEFELCALREWLAADREAPRRLFWAMVPVALAAEATWRRLTGEKGFVRAGWSPSLRVGQRCRIELATGDVVEGQVVVNAPPLEFAATAENGLRGLFRFGFERGHGVQIAHAWFESWSMEEPPFAALEARCTDALKRCLA
jgi:uncharacterized protein YndB with AHSA1/START domain